MLKFMIKVAVEFKVVNLRLLSYFVTVIIQFLII